MEDIRKVCMRCKKGIDENSNYYSFTEYDNKKVISIDYAHRVCWDNFLKQLTDLSKAQQIIGGARGFLQEHGVLPPEEVVIQ